jgi:hypothetical protein
MKCYQPKTLFTVKLYVRKTSSDEFEMMAEVEVVAYLNTLLTGKN